MAKTNLSVGFCSNFVNNIPNQIEINFSPSLSTCYSARKKTKKEERKVGSKGRPMSEGLFQSLSIPKCYLIYTERRRTTREGREVAIIAVLVGREMGGWGEGVNPPTIAKKHGLL
jgi:hypothetical protein